MMRDLIQIIEGLNEADLERRGRYDEMVTRLKQAADHGQFGNYMVPKVAGDGTVSQLSKALEDAGMHVWVVRTFHLREDLDVTKFHGPVVVLLDVDGALSYEAARAIKIAISDIGANKLPVTMLMVGQPSDITDPGINSRFQTIG